MRTLLLVIICLTSVAMMAQQPPIDLQWSAFYPSGSQPRIVLSSDGTNTAWMIEDEDWGMTSGDGIIWRYDSMGVPIESYWVVLSANCGSLDTHTDFTLRNDSMWSVSVHQFVGGDQPTVFCVNTPGSSWGPAPLTDFLTKRATDLLVTSSHVYICGSQDSTETIRKQSLYALDLLGNLIWDTVFNADQFSDLSHMAIWNDQWMVAEFPFLHHFSETDGSLISSQGLYMGASTNNGRIHVVGNELYWAAAENGIMHFGKLDANGAEAFSSTTPANDVTGLTVDPQGQMWVTCGQAPDNIKVIDASGATVSNYTYGAETHDVVFGNGQISIAGSLNTTTTESFLINGIP